MTAVASVASVAVGLAAGGISFSSPEAPTDPVLIPHDGSENHLDSEQAARLVELAVKDERVVEVLGDHRYSVGVISRTGSGDERCSGRACARIPFWDYDSGSTLYVLVIADSGDVLDVRPDDLTQPLPSVTESADALAIALVDPAVLDLLGDAPTLDGLGQLGSLSKGDCDERVHPIHRCFFIRVHSGDDRLYVWVDLTDRTVEHVMAEPDTYADV